MFGFLIKKNFCDGWDNMFALLIVNLVFLVSGTLILGGWRLLVIKTPVGESETLSFIIIWVALFLLLFAYNICSFAFGEQAVTIANFGGVKFADFFKKIPSVLKDAALYSLLITALTLLSYVGIRWYFAQGTYLYLFMGCVFVWFDLFAVLTLQWFGAIRSIMQNNFKKCLKKSLILMVDNTGFTIGMALYSLVLLAFSVFLIGFMPSVAGIILSRVNALRLRLYKYDYLELHPELKTKRERKDIPWEELLYEDKETLGPRKFRSFIFPWKE